MQADKESTLLDCLRFLEKQRFGIELQGTVLFMKQQGHMDSFAYKRAQPGIFFTNVNPFINLAQSLGRAIVRGSSRSNENLPP